MSDYEYQVALRESARNKSEDEYFNARKQLYSKANVELFRAGFDRGYEATIQDLQDKLALAQLENVKLREALNAMRDAFDVGGDVTSKENNALHKADKALSTPTTHAELDAKEKCEAQLIADCTDPNC